MQFLGTIDGNKIPIENARVHNNSGAPASPAIGQIYFNTGTSKFYGYNGSSWMSFDLGGLGATNEIAYWNGIGSLTGSSSLTWDGTSFGIGGTALAQIDIGATYVGIKRISIAGILQSAATTTHTVLHSQSFVDLTGSSTVSAVHGMQNVVSIMSSGGNPNVTTVRGIFGRIDTDAGYTGTIANARVFEAANPSLAGTQPITSLVLFYGNAITNGNGITSGTVTNYGYVMGTHSAAAAVGGTVTNHGAYLNVGTGSGAGTTTNYGLRIIGNGGSGGAGTTTNWAIYNESAADNYIKGNTGFGTLSAQSLVDISSITGGVLTLSRADTTATVDDVIGRIQFWNNDSQLVTQQIYAKIEAQASATVTTDVAAGRLVFYTTGPQVGSSPTERMRIRSSGEVGINDTNPREQLAVGGNTIVRGKLTADTVAAENISRDSRPNVSYAALTVSAQAPINPRQGDLWMRLA